MSKSSIRLPYRPFFFIVRPDGGVHSPHGQFPRLAQLTRICLGVGCKRKSKVLFGLARKPLLLFHHRGGVRPEEGKSVESIVEYEIIQFSRLRLADDLPRFVEALQGEQAVGKVGVGGDIIWGEAEALAIGLRSPLKLCPPNVHVAQIEMCSGVSRVVLYLLLIRLGRFIQFSSYILIVASGDLQLFPLAGVFPQLECLGEVLAGPP